MEKYVIKVLSASLLLSVLFGGAIRSAGYSWHTSAISASILSICLFMYCMYLFTMKININTEKRPAETEERFDTGRLG